MELCEDIYGHAENISNIKKDLKYHMLKLHSFQIIHLDIKV